MSYKKLCIVLYIVIFTIYYAFCWFIGFNIDWIYEMIPKELGAFSTYTVFGVVCSVIMVYVIAVFFDYRYKLTNKSVYRLYIYGYLRFDDTMWAASVVWSLLVLWLMFAMRNIHGKVAEQTVVLLHHMMSMWLDLMFMGLIIFIYWTIEMAYLKRVSYNSKMKTET